MQDRDLGVLFCELLKFVLIRGGQFGEDRWYGGICHCNKISATLGSNS